MNIIIILAVVVFIYAYAKLYLKPKRSVELLQTNLTNFDTNLLFEKQPILIFDQIVDPQNVIDVFFKYTHNLSFDSFVSPSTRQNLSRFMIVHNSDEKNHTISLAKYLTRVKHTDKNMFFSTVSGTATSDNQVNIVLPPKNVLVIPYLYTATSSAKLPALYLTDFVHVYF